MIHEFCISEVSFLNVDPVQGAVVLVLCPELHRSFWFCIANGALYRPWGTRERVSGDAGWRRSRF